MKRIILILILFFNIAPFVKQGHLNIIYSVEVNGQRTDCPTNVGGDNDASGGVLAAIGQALVNSADAVASAAAAVGKALGSAAGAFANTVAGLFSNDRKDENFGSEVTSASEWPVDPPEENETPSASGGDVSNSSGDNTTLQDRGVSSDDALIYNEAVAYARYLHGDYSSQAAKPRIDTAQPQKIQEDSAAHVHDSSATAILDSLNKLPEMQKLRDSVLGKYEHALTAYDSSGNYRTFHTKDTLLEGLHSIVIGFDKDTGANHKDIAVWAHTHTDSGDALPDAHDLYQFLKAYILYRQGNRSHLQASFIIAGDTAVDLAIIIEDRDSANAFYTRYPDGSTIAWDHLPDGTKYDPKWAKFKAPGDKYSMRQEFDRAVKKLRDHHYPKKLLWTYAQVYMMARYNVGLKILMKVDGVMRELSAQITRSPDGELTDLTINISN